MAITGPGRKQIPVNIIDNDDGTFTCAFVPEEAGEHAVDVKYADKTVPGSPFSFEALPLEELKPVVDESVECAVERQVESLPDFDLFGNVKAYGKGE